MMHLIERFYKTPDFDSNISQTSRKLETSDFRNIFREHISNLRTIELARILTDREQSKAYHALYKQIVAEFEFRLEYFTKIWETRNFRFSSYFSRAHFELQNDRTRSYLNRSRHLAQQTKAYDALHKKILAEFLIPTRIFQKIRETRNSRFSS